MDKIVRAWSAKILPNFDLHFSSPTGFVSQPGGLADTYGYVNHPNGVTVEAVLQWFQDEVNELLCKEVGAQFWSHFSWFDFSAVSNDDFASKLETSILEANEELLMAKKAVLEQYEALCEENLIQANFSAPGVQRALVRTLHSLETLWHLIVLPLPAINLSMGKVEAAIRSGLWKKLIFAVFSRYFDAMYGEPSEEEGEEDKEEEEDGKEGEDKKESEPPAAFVKIVSQLNTLSLVQDCDDVLKAIVSEKIQQRIEAKQKGVFDQEGQLEGAKEWVEKSCLSFLARVLCPLVEVDSLSDIMKDIESKKANARDSLRASQDSDEEDAFSFKPGFKRVPSTPARIAGHGYPVKDMSSSIKKKGGKRYTPYSKNAASGAEEYNEEWDDDEYLASSQPYFGQQYQQSSQGYGSGGVSSPLGNVSRMSSPLKNVGYPTSPTSSPHRMSSPLRPSSPGGKIPSSPIPLSSSLNAMSEWMQKHSIDGYYSKHSAQITIPHISVLGPSQSASVISPSLHPSNVQRIEALFRWRSQLVCFLYDLSSKRLISELFDMIVDYPNSLPALKDLRRCMSATSQYGDMVSSLRQALARRLMHPGATTADIVTIYVSTIRSIREIDPSNVLLSLVTVDLREYLRQRSDSLKSVVSLLTEDGGDSGISLISDLEESASNTIADADADEIDSDDDDDIAGANKSSKNDGNHSSSSLSSSLWSPAPIIRAPNLPSVFSSSSSLRGFSSRSKDIISMLIAIHGSKDHFIGEYANLLAGRLLEQVDFATENEVKHVELLKLKFGENAMLQCEVMLKDIAESKRATTNIVRSLNESRKESAKEDEDGEEDDEEENPNQNLSLAIFSHLYWPSYFQPLTVALPAPYQAQREAVEKAFSALKSSRSLVWYDTLGIVEIELSLSPKLANKIKEMEEGGSMDEIDMIGEEEEKEEGDSPSAAASEPTPMTFTVNTLQAAVIMLFTEEEAMSIDEVVKRGNLPNSEVAKKGLALWLTNGVLRETSPGHFVLADKLDMTDAVDDGEAMDGEAEEEAANHDQFIPFIFAMLKNLGSLPLSKIHQKMTNFNSDYDLTLQQLSLLLEKLVSSESLESLSGQYSLPKKK